MDDRRRPAGSVENITSRGPIKVRLWGPVLLTLVFAFTGCAEITVTRGEPGIPAPPAPAFQAGVAKVDITPPPGMPLFGYSRAGSNVGAGLRTRLYARAIYLETESGDRLALVQCDLGGISALLHRSVARRIVEETSVTVDRLLIAATHTHSGPGGYFAEALYDDFGSTRAGFDPKMVEFLVQRIAASVLQAHRSRAPAKLAVTQGTVWGLTRNRSLEPHRHNRVHASQVGPPYRLGPEYEAIDPSFILLRVDRVTPAGTEPLGVFSNFAIHGTVLSPANDLYTGDVHAAAERSLEWDIERQYPGAHDVVHAMTNGTEGDVQAAFAHQGFSEAERIGRELGSEAFRVFRSLDRQLTNRVALRRNYREVQLSEPQTVEGREVCQHGVMGSPVVGGSSEDSPTPLFYAGHILPFVHTYEGAHKPRPDGCQGSKYKAFGVIQNLLLPASAFPQALTLQTLQINELLLIALPGELTVEMGARVKAAARQAAKQAGQEPAFVAVVGLANQYASYFTTPEEYELQHYEGASTLFGPASGPLLAQEAARLVAAMINDVPPTVPSGWKFKPGTVIRYFPDEQKVVITRIARDTQVSCDGTRPTARFEWVDLAPGSIEFDHLLVRVDRQDAGGRWAPFLVDGVPVDDRGLDVEVRFLDHANLWRTTWYAEAELPGLAFRIAIEPRKGMPEIHSAEFTLVCQ